MIDKKLWINIAANWSLEDDGIKIPDTVDKEATKAKGIKDEDLVMFDDISNDENQGLYIDFKIDECRRREEFEAVLEQYVDFYNNHRPCYAIGYDTPVNYRKRYYKGELERKNTFENRVLSEEPKFVQKRRKQAHSGNVSTFRNENE